jgi:hypothetical protein
MGDVVMDALLPRNSGEIVGAPVRLARSRIR